MKAEELRIGLYLANASGEEYCLDHNSLIDVIDFHKVNGYTLWNPIPLTEEWLLKFGFEDSLPWKLENLILDSENRLSIVDDTGYGIIIARDVKYVHRLQNIYADLKQKELTITK